MLRLVFLVPAVLLLLWFGGRAVIHALASDETLIRWRLADMEAGYNEGDVGDAVAPIHREWRHEGTEMDRELLHGGLIREFFQDRDPETKKLQRRVDLDPDSIVVEVRGDTARVVLEASFSRVDQGAWQERWRARIESDWSRTDDGWKIVASRHTDLSGTQLSR